MVHVAFCDFWIVVPVFPLLLAGIAVRLTEAFRPPQGVLLTTPRFHGDDSKVSSGIHPIFQNSKASYSLYIALHASKDSLGIYVISLPTRVKRVRSFLEFAGLEKFAVIENAVLWNSFKSRILIESGQLSQRVRMNSGEIACSLSHRKTMADFLARPELTHAAIFEDDISLNSTLLSYMRNQPTGNSVIDLLAKLAATSETAGWDGLNMGRCFDHCGGEVIQSGILGKFDIESSCHSLCTHAYIMTRKGAEIMRNYTKPILTTEDRIRVALHHAGLMKYYSTSPAAFAQIPQSSDAIHPSQRPMECRTYSGVCDENLFILESHM
eukprot:jgi/Bigna1/79325/fgenesh1_pg.61_\